MTRRRPTSASVLLASLALLLTALAPTAAVAAPEDAEGVGVTVDISPLEEPTTEEPTTDVPTTGEPTTEEPTGDESPTGVPSPTDGPTRDGELPDTGADLTAALWLTGPLLAVGAALALLVARRRGATAGA